MKFLAFNLYFCFSVALANDVVSNFRASGIVPDVLMVAPSELLSVSFSNKTVEFGEELTPTLVKDAPTLSWNADESSLYTICMTDPDAPNRNDPKFREVLHWLVINVPGLNLSQGEVLAAYAGSGPPKDSGLHRYVLLVYKQPGLLDAAGEKHIPNNSREGRPKFFIQKFAEKYNLGVPIAGNMYQAQYDDYVPILRKQLSGQ